MVFGAQWIGLNRLKLSGDELLGDPIPKYFGDVTDESKKELGGSAPRRTGKLAGSFKPDVSKPLPGMGTVTSTVSYARFQAFGTRRHGPAGFWQRGLRKAEATMESRAGHLADDVEDEWG